jgi:hypothetical protein
MNLSRLRFSLLLLFALSLLTASSSLAQSPISEQKEVVAFLFGNVHQIVDGKPVTAYMVLGTAFLIEYPDKRGGPDYGFYYIATAKHVLRDTDGKFIPSVDVRLNLRSASGEDQTDKVQLPVTDANGNLLWLHSNDDADEAVVLPFLPDMQKFEFKAIPTDMFVSDSELKSDAVQEGDNLYFIGLMAQFYGTKRNSPVVRRGTLAMMTDEKVATLTGPQKVFIAELQSWPGNSGSPVFLNLNGFRGSTISVGGGLKFLGILLGSFLNKVSGTVGNLQFIGGDGANTGISLIVPAASLKAILDSDSAQKSRDQAISAIPKKP